MGSRGKGEQPDGTGLAAGKPYGNYDADSGQVTQGPGKLSLWPGRPRRAGDPLTGRGAIRPLIDGCGARRNRSGPPGGRTGDAGTAALGQQRRCRRGSAVARGCAEGFPDESQRREGSAGQDRDRGEEGPTPLRGRFGPSAAREPPVERRARLRKRLGESRDSRSGKRAGCPIIADCLRAHRTTRGFTATPREDRIERMDFDFDVTGHLVSGVRLISLVRLISHVDACSADVFRQGEGRH